MMRVCQIGSCAVFLSMLAATGWSADFEKGKQAYNSADYETALQEWKPLAAAGDPNGQFGMGLLYGNGAGVPLDDNEALKWYRLAAEQGHAQAQCNLAVMHANGWGVPQSDEEAFKWYMRAAEQGVTAAITSIADMYAGGFGVAADKLQAHKWFSIAAELGDIDAGFKLESLAAGMSADEIAEAERLKRAWIADHEHRLVTD